MSTSTSAGSPRAGPPIARPRKPSRSVSRGRSSTPDIEVGIEDPEVPELSIVLIRLSAGGLATSSVAKRTWAPGEHHVIDPRTGRPAATDLLQATAWAPTCVEAEVRATSALLEGRAAAGAIHTVLVATDGDVLVSFPEAAAA